MLHLIPTPANETAPQPYAEAVARLASVRHALRLVDPFGSGPASDNDDAVAAAWDGAGEARQRVFDKRSARLVGATAAAVETLLQQREAGREPHLDASAELVEQIRRELQQVAGIVLG